MTQATPHPFNAIILAAGKGTRMKSALPKVLHPLCGSPMISFVLGAAREAGARKCVTVIGHGAESVRGAMGGEKVVFVIQEEQKGTGHAVMICREAMPERDLPIVIVCGDTPLLQASTLSALVERHQAEGHAVTVLTAEVADPRGYGRIIKDGGQIERIVEEKDASPAQRQVREINSGVYCVDGDFLFDALDRVDCRNVQGEYYLTDIVAIGRKEGKRVGWSRVADQDEILGINSRKELALAGRLMRRRIIDRLMEEGVTVEDPDTTYVDPGVRVGRDVVLSPQVRLEGKTSIGQGSRIETGSILTNAVVGEDVHIRPYSIVADALLKARTVIGPFAHLRPGSVIEAGAKVGNFVEIKKSVIGEGSKANHLTYIGDARVGEGVNIGAGTITCNYDGYNKFETVIEDGAFIGSGTNLVAPVTVGKGSIVGAGSTITKNVPADALSLTRPDQRSLMGWAKKKRESKEKK